MSLDYDKWNDVEAGESEEAAPATKASLNVDEATESSHRCRLSAQQVDEIFAKVYVPNSSQQNGLKLWREDQEGVPFLRAAPMSVGGGLPEDWEIETTDTHRWCRFRWKPIDCIAVPPMQSRSKLFEAAMKILERIAVPANLLLARYQLPLCVNVVLAGCPMEPLVRFVESQALCNRLEGAQTDPDQVLVNDEVKAESRRAREEWYDAGLSEDTLRAISMALFQIRADCYPSSFIIYSIPDDQVAVVVCRDIEMAKDNFHRRLPVLRDATWVEWPLMDDHFAKDAEGKTVPRSVPLAAEEAMALALKHKQQGTDMFKSQDFAKGREEYSIAAEQLDRVDTAKISEADRNEEQSLRLSLKLNCSLCSLKLSEWDAAIAHATEALELDSKSAKAFYRRALGYKEKHDWDAATSDLHQAEILDPEDTAVAKLLREIHKAKQQEDKKAKLAMQRAFGGKA